jgi:hypothetical protein
MRALTVTLIALFLSSHAYAGSIDRLGKKEKRKPLLHSEWGQQGDGPNPCAAIKDACRRAGHYDVERHGENKQKTCVKDVLAERQVYKVNVSARDIEACRKSKEAY